MHAKYYNTRNYKCSNIIISIKTFHRQKTVVLCTQICHSYDPYTKPEVNISPKNEYFCITPKNGSAQECGSKGRPHGNISAQKSDISAQNPKNAFFCMVK